jgi:diguanylate cyclase (GGDEF)-like protein
MGDRAIIQAADLLKRALPPTCPLGRTGGDEFTALFVEHEGYSIEDFMKRIREGCQGFNRHSGLPFLVCISAGCFSFTADQGSDLSALLKKADESLYLAKKNRLSSVIRPATGDRQD